jgi:hypothetical protein
MFDMMAESANFGANIGACSQGGAAVARQRVASRVCTWWRWRMDLLRLHAFTSRGRKLLATETLAVGRWLAPLRPTSSTRDRQALSIARHIRGSTPPVAPPRRAQLGFAHHKREDPLRAFETHSLPAPSSNRWPRRQPTSPLYVNSARVEVPRPASSLWGSIPPGLTAAAQAQKCCGHPAPFGWSRHNVQPPHTMRRDARSARWFARRTGVDTLPPHRPNERSARHEHVSPSRGVVSHARLLRRRRVGSLWVFIEGGGRRAAGAARTDDAAGDTQAWRRRWI